MKPTPGPYKIDDKRETYTMVIRSDGQPIAWFNSCLPQEQANAEAWIAGVAAMADLNEIRRAYNKPNSSFDEFMMVVRKVLGP